MEKLDQSRIWSLPLSHLTTSRTVWTWRRYLRFALKLTVVNTVSAGTGCSVEATLLRDGQNSTNGMNRDPLVNFYYICFTFKNFALKPPVAHWLRWLQLEKTAELASSSLSVPVRGIHWTSYSHRAQFCSTCTTWLRFQLPCLHSATTACSWNTQRTLSESSCTKACSCPCPQMTPCTSTTPR